jgi:hypothetical protein
VKRSELEQQVLKLWMTSRVPLTRANLQFYTGVGRERLERWLGELVGSGVLEVDSDDAGELIWTVPGAERPHDGPTKVVEVQKLEQLRSELGRTPSRALVPRANPLDALALPGGRDDKSLVASGALSFFLGPVGWLYAAPLKEAVPAILVYLVALSLLPHVLLYPLLGIFAPLSALTGAAYAWRHNQRGERTSLLDPGRRSLPPRRSGK